ncbi:HNH endonuclease signature motif containing protein [Kutzneria buriramensis]|uniref:HNH endonuclease n=1 Tax=Kutzneria buriramensis TaxID=1045776 RepID=A0A3E0HHT1_9PSEU|nr:HNH endonuclease signature motif containing protein [Kutzneria buriramensis]REH45942.1 HNH endonuclease [Kutzneria buriramensis]
MEATWDATAAWRMDDTSLWHACDQAQKIRQSAYVRLVEMVAELWNRTGRSKEDRVSMVAQVQTQLRVSKKDALQIVAHAQLFGREAVRDAARAGELDADRLTVLDQTLAQAPVLDRDEVEAELINNTHLPLHHFRLAAKRILVLLDQDGPEPRDDPARPKREFHYNNRPDGSVAFRGTIDSESGAMLAALISPLAKPKADDTRTTPQRQGDAFADMIELAAGSENLPDEGGERPHLAITMHIRDFLQGLRGGEFEDGEPVDAETGRRIACDSKAFRMVLEENSAPINIGRSSRTVPIPMRRALIVRDKGCAFPGCHRRPRQCHAHHVIHWADGGPTRLDNLVLACSMHHRMIHHTRWTVEIVDGLPVFTPPGELRPGHRSGRPNSRLGV